MFTRAELEVLTIPELRNLCQRYGVKPIASTAYKASCITSLMAFPQLALHQMQEGRGLKVPTFTTFQYIGVAIDEMGSPTDAQIALIRVTLEGRRMSHPDRYEQEKLLNWHKAKILLAQASALLSQ